MGSEMCIRDSFNPRFNELFARCCNSVQAGLLSVAHEAFMTTILALHAIAEIELSLPLKVIQAHVT